MISFYRGGKVSMVKMEIDLSKLKELRIRAGLTRKEFAETIGQGCLELTVYRWETGKIKKPIPVYQKALVKFYKDMDEK